MAIFLSYSRKDEVVVKALAQGFDSARREVWFDHDLGGGDAWWDSILENIRSATIFLFALSDASLHSKPCRLELDYALAIGRPILPVQVGPVSSLRANPLAELQIVSYSPDNAQSGFTILAAVDDAAERLRPLPDPLPPSPPIPFAYLLALGRQIDSTELSLAEQVAVVDQLRRSLGEETDESVRQDVLSMLKNLNSKPWTAKRTEREIAALLYAHAPTAVPAEEPDDAQQALSPQGAEPRATPVPPASGQDEPDPREWFAERLDELQRQRATQERALDPDPPPWRPPTDALGQWSRTFRPSDRPGAPAGGASFVGTSPAAPPTAGAAARMTPVRPYFAGQATDGQPAAGPAAPPATAATASEPPSYWALSIASFLLSVLFGAVAMFFSYQVGRRHRRGDVEGARGAAANAKVWGIVGVIVGVFVWLVSVS